MHDVVKFSIKLFNYDVQLLKLNIFVTISISLASATSTESSHKSSRFGLKLCENIMYFKIKLNQYNRVVLLMFFLVVPCNIAILFGDYTYTAPIGKYSNNIFYNILRMQPYKDHILSKLLNIEDFYANLFSLTKHAFRR